MPILQEDNMVVPVDLANVDAAEKDLVRLM